MATALASGAAALVWTLQPAASYQEVAGILKDTADKVGTDPLTGQPIPYANGRNDYFGYGRLNVGQAARRAYPPTLTPITEIQEFLLGGSTTQQTRLLTLTNPSSQRLQWRATVVQGDAWLSVIPTSGIAEYGNPGALMLQSQLDRLGNRALLRYGARGASAGSISFSSFDIEVKLHSSSTLSRTFLPVTTRDWASPEWFDPFDGSDPYRQALGLANNEVRQLRLPFPVTLYGQGQTRIGISDNGLVIFGQSGIYQMYPPAGCLQTAPRRTMRSISSRWIGVPTSAGRRYTSISRMPIRTWSHGPRCAVQTTSRLRRFNWSCVATGRSRRTTEPSSLLHPAPSAPKLGRHRGPADSVCRGRSRGQVGGYRGVQSGAAVVKVFPHTST